MPVMPQNAAGWRMEPPVSVPVAAGVRRAATAAALPPDEPPTDDHGWWPETYLPPFHFSNPVATYVPESAPAADVEAAAAGVTP